MYTSIAGLAFNVLSEIKISLAGYTAAHPDAEQINWPIKFSTSSPVNGDRNRNAMGKLQ